MKTIKLQFYSEGKPEQTFWEEARVADDVDGKAHYKELVKNFNETLRPHETTRIITQLVDPKPPKNKTKKKVAKPRLKAGLEHGKEEMNSKKTLCGRYVSKVKYASTLLEFTFSKNPCPECDAINTT